MYPELAAESMPWDCRPVSRVLVCCLVSLVLLVALSGCGSRNLSGDESAFLAGESEIPAIPADVPAPDDFHPVDDGIALTPEERKALFSVGDFDRDLGPEELRDVALHFKSLVHKGRSTVNVSIERARAYMPHIRKILREEKLPAELAYLAFVESNYNPFARSRSGALGLWQFIPGTGRYCGLRQDWWMDERRDPYISTRAAAAYLTELYNRFRDWHLAVSAYNAGPGKIARGLEATEAESFFELRRRNDRITDPKNKLSEENREYLLKFLAVCKIMRNLDLLGFPELDKQATTTVALEVRPGTDLVSLCKALGMDWKTFFNHNAGFQRGVTPPGSATKVYVPTQLSLKAEAALRKIPARNYSGWKFHKVRRGETLPRIARRIGVPVAELRRVNRVSEPLKSGSRVLIPATRQALAEAAPGTSGSGASGKRQRAGVSGSGGLHVVQSGETLYSIAKSYNLRHEDVMAHNGLSHADIRPGQRLHLPGSTLSERNSSRADRKKAGSAPSRAVTYKVRSGDTLWAIARKFNVPATELLALNNMNRTSTLRPGDTVRVRN